MKLPRFAVNKRAAGRLDAGHPWVFANELSVPAKELPSGGAVDITAPDGRFIGRGFANPASLIAVRLCTRDKTQHIDLPGFWAARLREAVTLRRAVFGQAHTCRLVAGEADGFPGLVIDRYGDVVVAQVSALGMEQRLPVVLEALHDVLPEVTSGVLRNDLRSREPEGLEPGRGAWFGEAPETVVIEEEGVRFRVSPLSGLRTGHFYDQRSNRLFAAGLCEGKTVLDVYAYTGAWGLHALARGAEQVVFVEKKAEACEGIDANLEENGFGDRGVIIQDEGKKTLEAMRVEGHRYGAVILDPPPFAKTRKAAGSALRGYKEITGLAMDLVEPGGFLFTSSCSVHVFEERYLEAIQQAAMKSGKVLRMVRRGEQSPDHPVLPGMPETRVLKSFAFQVLPQW